MKRFLSALLIVYLLASCAFAEGAGTLSFSVVPALLRPGKLERISFIAPGQGVASIYLKTREGVVLMALREDMTVASGQNSISWNGNYPSGLPVSEGAYALRLEMSGQAVEAPITIGAQSPQIKQAYCDGTTLIVDSSAPGMLLVQAFIEGKYRTLFEGNVIQGLAAFDVGDVLDKGVYTLSLWLTQDGFTGGSLTVSITVGERVQGSQTTTVKNVVSQQKPVVTQKPEPLATEKPSVAPSPTATPAATSAVRSPFSDYWAQMTGDVVVLSGEGFIPMLDRAGGSAIAGIAAMSQCVTVLSIDGDWAEVVAYNADMQYGPLDVLFTGFVDANLLETVTPRSDYGLLINKQEQTMTVLADAQSLGVMRISSGFPYAETVSGQFLVTERTGDLPVNETIYGKALRLYGDVYISELGHTGAGAAAVYSGADKLGEKNSMGSVYVPYEKDAAGLSMQLLWNKIRKNASVIVLDDDEAPAKPRPELAITLYYNPDGGQFYHLDSDCSSIRKRYRPLKGVLTYQELTDEKYKKLTPCEYCKPPERPEDIE